MNKRFRIPIVFLAAFWFLASCGPSTLGPSTPGPISTLPVSTLTVNSNNDNDDGACNAAHCSLREAINKANTLAGTVTIKFNIGGGGPQTIHPASDLPYTSYRVIIDGTSQPGFTGSPIIELDGSGAGVANGLSIGGDNSTVKGLVINRFSSDGIQVYGKNISIVGNYIGTDLTGTVAMGNHEFGIEVYCNSMEAPTGAVIGGPSPAERNVISGNGQAGIDITAGSDCQNYETQASIRGNYIGTDVTGNVALGNQARGIHIETADDNTIGGSGPGEGNLISGNQGNGIELLTATNSPAPNRIEGNYIGTNAIGNLPLDNAQSGIADYGRGTLIGGEDPGAGNVISGNTWAGIDSGDTHILIKGNRIGTDAGGTAALGNGNGIQLWVCAMDQEIGGLVPAARNIISGNTGDGIYLTDESCPVQNIKVSIFGNYIGTNFNGTGAIGNRIGVHVVSAGARIGGDAAGMMNLISGNTVDGIIIEKNGAQVVANYIGMDITGNNPLPNGGNGVLLTHGAANNRIRSNFIAYNGRNGVAVLTANGTGNTISQNSIHDNAQLGIAVDEEAVIPNDPQDPDGGANNRQNYPVLLSAITDPVAVNTTFTGTLDGTPNTTTTIEFFTNAACDPSGYGEGHRLVKSLAVTTDAGGHAAISAFFPSTVFDTGNFITATATDPYGNTSEFSNCIPVTEAATATPSPTSGGMQFQPTVNPMAFFYGGCTPDRIDITLSLTEPPDPQDYMLLFVRVVDKKSGEAGGWSQGLSMLKLSETKFFFTLTIDKIPDSGKFADAWLQYQFVAYNKSQKEIGRSQVFSDVSFGRCGRAGTTQTKKPGMTG